MGDIGFKESLAEVQAGDITVEETDAALLGSLISMTKDLSKEGQKKVTNILVQCLHNDMEKIKQIVDEDTQRKGVDKESE